ncbi:relaxase/mobilization nuclease domain-containing protein [Variovorax sp. NFACC27]|uniref:relaxase/mobilization nuclease domain-containing protein n=1 Tax=unclassified Variovorax TaxID=663243 RepID=UPI00089892EA|nr:Relaxase/Mobilisation nuclease domain-containing protein [Variovorax sp. NFACC28]SEG86052.1 Relaxase/Mobilisation nuclease domain-containing protein [Variovorax sp. NFACC29]SFD22803.1 Relaxase/Mobilisation nuclease domain-containing protein [Variovorax sp. NFACC26]SFG29635.1 Relaxase/Mobilisation nuclease domain-containing protein [Variovorax sp. NFACC27]
MPERTVRLARTDRGPANGVRDMALDIVSYGRRGPGGTLRFGSGEITQVQRTVGRTPEVMVKVSGGGRDVGGVEAHLGYISRHGKLPIEIDEGPAMQGRGAPREVVTDWQLELCRSQYKPRPAEGQKDTRAKLVHDIVLSMPAGTPPQKVLTAARVFARENFALQHRYAMVLHTDQPHPHVHLAVKCEHEFEPGQRLYIRKETLRQRREQFAALMREQGVAANATPRQVRGQVRKPYKDAIHHRLRALRAFGQLPMGERAGRRAPKTSTFMRAKLDSVLHALQARQGTRDAGKEAMQRTRQEVAVDWRATADALRRHGQGELAARVERFVARMPSVQTDAQRMAGRWREVGRSRAQELVDVKSPGPHIR